jgi:DNA-binding response OmpR family regulator
MMSPPTILLISADESTSRIVTTCLAQEGYKVIRSSRGLEAFDLVRREDPAIVILDFDLPDINSLAIIRALRADDSHRSLPLILLGASRSEEDVLIGLEVGADLCLPEPFHPRVFIAHVHSLLRRSEILAKSVTRY